jgi:hypothetical protein
MTARYFNRNTGQTVELPTPNRRLERLPNWQRLDAVEQPKQITATATELKRLRKADVQQLCRDAGVSDEGTVREMVERLSAVAEPPR